MTVNAEVQKALNTVRGYVEDADWSTRLEILELILASSQSVVSLARKLTEPEVRKKTVIVPRTKTVKRYVDVPQSKSKNDTEAQPKSLEPIQPSPPLPNQRDTLNGVKN